MSKGKKIGIGFFVFFLILLLVPTTDDPSTDEYLEEKKERERLRSSIFKFSTLQPPKDFPTTQLKFMNTLDSLRVEFKRHKKENNERLKEAEKTGNNLAITEAQKPYLDHIKHHAYWIDDGVTNEAYNRSNCCNGWLVQFVSLYGPYDDYDTGKKVYEILTEIKSEDSDKGIRININGLKYGSYMKSLSKGDWLEVNGYFKELSRGYVMGYWGSEEKFQGQSISIDFLDGNFSDDLTVELGERMLNNYYSGSGGGRDKKGKILFSMKTNSIKKATKGLSDQKDNPKKPSKTIRTVPTAP